MGSGSHPRMGKVCVPIACIYAANYLSAGYVDRLSNASAYWLKEVNAAEACP